MTNARLSTGRNILARRHIYILDTCVLLHDPKSLYKFENNDIYIPLAVIDDLDEHKTMMKESKGMSAREVFRHLKKLDLSLMTDKGVVINDKGGKLFIYNNETLIKKGDVPNISRSNSDNGLITTCLELQAKYPKRKVSIVTKDTGLRVRAEAWGCHAENYRNDLLEDDKPYGGIRYVVTKTVPMEDEVEIKFLNKSLQGELANLSPNEFVVFKNDAEGEEFEQGVYRHFDGILVKIDMRQKKMMGITPRNIEQDCATALLMDESIPLVCLSGRAGTGKTILALATALDQINSNIYQKLIVIKPIIPVGGRDIGALPGDKWEKLSAWLGPIRDNLEQLCGNFGVKGSRTFEDAIEEGLIEAEAMAFIQGRSIPNSVILIDEAQNLTPREARMVVERCGDGSKVIMLGDVSQIENPYLDRQSCGLAHAINGAKTKSLCGAITLKTVTRSALAALAGDIFTQPEAQGK